MTISRTNGPLPKKLPHRRRVVKTNGTKAGREHMARVATLPCCLYLNYGADCGGRTTCHHPQGMDFRAGFRRASDFDVIALCEAHHQGIEGKFKNSITHLGIKAWTARHGAETYLLDLTRYRLRLCGFPDGSERE